MLLHYNIWCLKCPSFLKNLQHLSFVLDSSFHSTPVAECLSPGILRRSLKNTTPPLNHIIPWVFMLDLIEGGKKGKTKTHPQKTGFLTAFHYYILANYAQTFLRANVNYIEMLQWRCCSRAWRRKQWYWHKILFIIHKVKKHHKVDLS